MCIRDSYYLTVNRFRQIHEPFKDHSDVIVEIMFETCKLSGVRNLSETAVISHFIAEPQGGERSNVLNIMENPL